MGQRPRPLLPYQSVRHFFGAELRTWRQRRGHSQAALGSLVLHSGAEICKVEKAERWPTQELAKRCDLALDTGGVLTRLWPLLRAERGRRPALGESQVGHADRESGMLANATTQGTIEVSHSVTGQVIVPVTTILPGGVPDPCEDVVVPVDRRSFILSSGAFTLGGEQLVSLSTRGAAPLPGRIGMDDVAEVEAATDTVAAWDLRRGGRLAAEQGIGLLRWALSLLECQPNEPVRSRLFSAAGYLADRIGWALFDCGRHNSAQGLFQGALALACEAGDVDLRTQILCDMASQLVFLGHPDRALRLVDGIEQQAPVPCLKAAVHGVRAEAHASRGTSNQVWAEIDYAEHACAVTPNRPGPRWLEAFRGPVGTLASTGYASYLLQRNSGSSCGTAAIIRMEEATNALPETRSRALLSAKARLATLHVTCSGGDPATGFELAGDLLELIPRVNSVRVIRDIRTFRTALACHEHQPDIAAIGRSFDLFLDSTT